jgi:hypothetical protein
LHLPEELFMASDITHTVPTAGFGQATYQQCWYASYKMIYSFKGLNVNSIKDKLAGVINVDDALANGLLDTDYKKCATALGLSAFSGGTYNAERGFFDVGLSDGAEALHDELANGPLWVSRYIKKGTYHIVVVKAYDDAGDGYFIYNNPYPGPSNAVEVRENASLFSKFITNAAGSVQR